MTKTHRAGTSLLLLSFLLLVSPQFVRGASQRTLTRTAAVQFAMRFNPKWRATKARLKTALARLKGAKIFPYNPVLEAKGKSKTTPGSGGLKTTLALLDVEFSWKLPTGGWWNRRIVLAKHTLERVRAELKSEAWTLALKVHKAYNKALISQKKVSLYRNIVKSYQSIKRATERRLREGEGTRLNLLNANVSLLSNQTTLIAARAERRLNHQRLFQLLGWKKDSYPTLTSPLPTHSLPSQTAQKWLTGIARHPWIRIADRRIREAKSRRNMADGKVFPDLKFKLNYSFEPGQIHKIGAGFEIPIPVLFRNQEKRWASAAKIREVTLKRSALLFHLRQKTQQEYQRMQQRLQIWRLFQKRLLPLNRAAVLLRKKGLRMGAIPILRLLSAQKSLQKAQIGRLLALEDLLNSVLELCKTTGQLPSWK